MIQRLLLDGIDLQRGRRSIPQAVELAAFIDAYEAEPGLSRIDVAVAWAKIAVNAAAGFRLPPARLMKRIGFLEDIQLRHPILLPTRLVYAPNREKFFV
jgi:hypothetical protein